MSGTRRRTLPLFGDQSGFSLLEVLVTSVIFGVSVGAIYMLLENYRMASRKVQNLGSADTVVANLFQVLRENAVNTGIRYEPMDPDQALQKAADLPLEIGFSKDTVAPINSCRDCPGRVGYLVYPVAGNRGLYTVVVKVEHKEAFPEGPRVFQFIVGQE